MALLNLGKVWDCDFVIDGVRHRQSPGKTTGAKHGRRNAA